MILKNHSIDCVIFGFLNNRLNVLLWQVESEVVKKFFTNEDNYESIKVLFDENPIHKSGDYWGVIGSHLPADKNMDDYARFILNKTTGLNKVFLKQVKTFGSVNRVPFSRVITTAFYTIINPEYHDMRQSEMAKILRWFEVDNLPKMLFDHAEIIQTSVKELRKEAKYHPVGYQLLPDKFTLTQIQSLYETVLNQKLDTRNFRKKIQKMGLLIDTDEKQTGVAHRAAKLYTFNLETYNRLKEEGLSFRI